MIRQAACAVYVGIGALLSLNGQLYFPTVANNAGRGMVIVSSEGHSLNLFTVPRLVHFLLVVASKLGFTEGCEGSHVFAVTHFLWDTM